MRRVRLFCLLSLVLFSLVSCLPRTTEAVLAPNQGKPLSNAEVPTKPSPSLSASLNFALPIANASILSGFNEQGSGLVLRTPEPEEAVKAVEAGLVTEMTKFSANDGYLVTIEHANKLSTSYLNLKAVPLVVVGDRVSKNQTIGFLGGGSLTPANVLKFFASKLENGTLTFIDPNSLIQF